MENKTRKIQKSDRWIDKSH
uniref:Uncharacterized protein n=1 Tax=Arundo donax TaxID=35708 RepID=A0A0A8Y8T8_ARUDO